MGLLKLEPFLMVNGARIHQEKSKEESPKDHEFSASFLNKFHRFFILVPVNSLEPNMMNYFNSITASLIILILLSSAALFSIGESPGQYHRWTSRIGRMV